MKIQLYGGLDDGLETLIPEYVSEFWTLNGRDRYVYEDSKITNSAGDLIYRFVEIREG